MHDRGRGAPGEEYATRCDRMSNVPVNALRDEADKWESVRTEVAKGGAAGIAVGTGLALLLFAKRPSQAMCAALCTGAGVGHGLTRGKGAFEEPSGVLPTLLAEGAPPPPTPPTCGRGFGRMHPGDEPGGGGAQRVTRRRSGIEGW